MNSSGGTGRMTWASWASGLLRRQKRSATLAATQRKKARTASTDPARRPRFAEPLEGRRMLTAAGPINFTASQFYQLDTGQVRVGSFVNGGLPDLVGVDGPDNAVHVLLNNGDGTFHLGHTFYVPDARSLTVGDFNHDGNQDIAVASPDSNIDVTDTNPGNGTGNNNNGNGNTTIDTGVQNTIYIFYGNGDGTFSPPAKQIAVGFRIVDLTNADLNGDGYPDLIASIGRRVLVLINRGDNKFFAPVGYAAGAKFGGRLTVGDFNNDGIPDIAVTRFQANEIAILLGQKNLDGTPTGTFGKRELYHVGTNPRDLAVGDFNGDGNEDLAVVNSDFRTPSLWVFLGNGDGTFAKPQSYTGGNFVQSVTTGDFNGDGKTDIVTVSFTSYLRAYAGNGDGTFQPFKEFPTSSFGQNVVTADLNGDGIDDIATATGGGIRVLLATTQPTPPVTPTSLDVALGNGAPRSITYKDVSGSPVTISLSGPGSADITFSGADLSLNGSGTTLIGGPASVSLIAATGTTTASTLAIKPAGKNGLVSIGGITTDGSFKTIDAPRANLIGDLTVAGTVSGILFDTANTGTITLAGTGPAASLILRNATDENLNSAQPISTLSVGQWASSTATQTTITAPAIGTIRSTHQFATNMNIGAGGISAVKVRNIPQGVWNVAGAVGTMYAGRDIQLTLTATSIKSIFALNTLSNLFINTTGDIGSISAGSMINSSIYAGVGPLASGQRLPDSAADFTGTATIGSVNLVSREKISSFTNSSIAAPTVRRVSLGTIVFEDMGLTQGLAASSIGVFSGLDHATGKHFVLTNPTSLLPLTQRGIDTADFVLQIV